MGQQMDFFFSSSFFFSFSSSFTPPNFLFLLGTENAVGGEGDGGLCGVLPCNLVCQNWWNQGARTLSAGL